jgi:TonB family protein
VLDRTVIIFAPLVAGFAAAAQPAAPPVPPPPLVSGGPFATVPLVPAIVRFTAGPPRCGGEEQSAVVAEEPFPRAHLQMGASRRLAEFRLRFRIDADGRPLGIAFEPLVEPGSEFHDARDVPAAFAAWRFAPGPERRDCTIRFTPVVERVDSARPESLFRFVALHRLSGQRPVGEVGRAAFERIKPADSTCYEPRPDPRLFAYPPFQTMSQPQGTVSYSWVGHDIAADGRVRNLRLLAGSGNAELDRETVAALSRSRFQPGARRGCLYHFYRRERAPMAPPPLPDESGFRPAGATCPAEEPEWRSMPPLEFPEEFNRRGIEGWAILRYDLAPWGATGNVTVVAAEPAAAFGEQAARIVRGAQAAAGPGYVGCTGRVIFRLPRDGKSSEEE